MSLKHTKIKERKRGEIYEGDKLMVGGRKNHFKETVKGFSRVTLEAKGSRRGNE